jgi:hypothetical protein
MRNVAAMFLSLSVLAATALLEARAGDAEIITEVNKAAAALDQAFAEQNVEEVKKLMSPDHIAVTPYYPEPQGVDGQIASLADLKFEQEIAGEVAVSLIGDEAALRTFKAKQRGSFKGRPIPKHVFVSQLMIKQDGAWVEHFYQVTALVPRKLSPKQRLACRYPIGTYLTKNKPKGEIGDSFTSRSLLSLGSAHLALFTDSGEGGEAGFAPFTEGRGNWYCRPGDDGKLSVKATTFDFTAPEAGGQLGGIGRLDFDLTFDVADKTLAGTATLYLLPLGGDPLDANALKDGREFEISGQSVRKPDR